MPYLAPNEYINRRNRVGKYRHWKICNHYDIETPDKWYEHKSLPVVDWNFPIRTDKIRQFKRPDIAIKNKQNKTCQMINMNVPSDSNISAKDFEKLSKYKDLEIEISKIWKRKTKTMPVIVRTLGMIKKGIRKYVNEIPGNLSLAEIQKMVLNSIA